MSYTVGFDIGGSHVRAGVLDASFAVLKTADAPFPKDAPAALPGLIADMTAGLAKGLPGETPESVGLAVPGSISRDGERVIRAYNLGLRDYPLRALAGEKITCAPVFLGNDADCAAMAEHALGALYGMDTAVLLTLGTGLGGGVIMGGRLWRGGLNNGVEIGHMIIDSGGERCTCGNSGCAETMCSATALIRGGRAAMDKSPALAAAAAARGGALDARAVVECARRGDPEATKVFNKYVDSLGSLCASLINIIDPEAIAIGGGVSAAGDFLFEPLRADVARKSFYKRHAAVLAAVAGNDAGMLGAAMLAQGR